MLAACVCQNLLTLPRYLLGKTDTFNPLCRKLKIEDNLMHNLVDVYAAVTYI